MQLHFNHILSFYYFLTNFICEIILFTMSNGYICVYDSGIGGISLLCELQKILPNERYLYLGDNDNVPYGNKSRRQLLSLSVNNLSLAMRYSLKAVVLGCNTLSLTIREELSDILGVAVFGVFPPVESEIMKGNNALLISTTNTAKNYKTSDKLSIHACDGLATFIEDNALNLDKISLQNYFNDIEIVKRAYDIVILGCTHYSLTTFKILDHLNTQKTTSGNHLTAKFLFKYLKNTKSLGNYKRNSVIFLGKNAHKNEEVYFKVVKTRQFNEKNYKKI